MKTLTLCLIAFALILPLSHANTKTELQKLKELKESIPTFANTKAPIKIDKATCQKTAEDYDQEADLLKRAIASRTIVLCASSKNLEGHLPSVRNAGQFFDWLADLIDKAEKELTDAEKVEINKGLYHPVRGVFSQFKFGRGQLQTSCSETEFQNLLNQFGKEDLAQNGVDYFIINTNIEDMNSVLQASRFLKIVSQKEAFKKYLPAIQYFIESVYSDIDTMQTFEKVQSVTTRSQAYKNKADALLNEAYTRARSAPDCIGQLNTKFIQKLKTL